MGGSHYGTQADVWTALDWALDHDEGQMAHFMFMGRATGGSGQTIFLYKHTDTRRYLNADLGGNCYQFDPQGDYRPVGRAKAITHAFSQG